MLGHMAEKLVTDALEQVVGGENPPDDFSLFHDGRGSRHTSRTFQRCFESHGIARFMSRSGNPMGGDALAESLFKMLKCEPVTARPQDEGEAKQDMFKCIELNYNRRRMHSSIGYNAPCDLEQMLPEEANFPSKKLWQLQLNRIDPVKLFIRIPLPLF